MIHEDISQYHKHGALEGYVTDGNAENLRNHIYDLDREAAEAMADFARDRQLTVALLETLNVDEDHRHRGIGSLLFDAALEAAFSYGVDLVVLFADTAEENAFNLIEWYESRDFIQIVPGKSGTIMAAGDAAEDLQNHVCAALVVEDDDEDAPTPDIDVGPAAGGG